MKWLFGLTTMSALLAALAGYYAEQYARAAYHMASATFFLICTLHEIYVIDKE